MKWKHGLVGKVAPHANLWFVLSFSLFGATPAAQAEMRALLVGVSSYAAHPLKGPRNDVQRMREVLERRAFKPAQITTLADGVPKAAMPTRGAILTALDDLADRSTAGDTVFLYFSGHGSQQPADRNTPQGRAEPDGLHETFLPLDIGHWDGRVGTVRNALIDFELRHKVDSIVARGAFVWAVFDTCHAATLVRGAPEDEVRFRYISPRTLGVPPAAIDRARSSHTAQDMTLRGLQSAPRLGDFDDRPANRPGSAVYFYASQSTELTPEMLLPPGATQREVQGFFGFVLRLALASDRPMSYRQLGQVILAHYASLNRTSATPIFAGNGLDRLVLGQQTIAVHQWPVSPQNMTVPVGALSGLAEGARFALMPNAQAGAEEAIGSLRATRVGLNHAELEPMAWADQPAPNLRPLPIGTHARLLMNPERFSLRVTVDDRRCSVGCRWHNVLNAIRRQGAPGINLQWVDQGGDLILRLSNKELIGLPPRAECGSGGALCNSPQHGSLLLSAADGKDPERLVRQLALRLHALARATNLLRLAARTTAPDSLGMEASVAIHSKRDGMPAVRTANSETVAYAEVGDQLVVNLHNRSNTPSDVTLLYLDAQYGIHLLFPTRAGEVNRLEAGARLPIDDIKLSANEDVFGVERLLVIAVEAEHQSQRADFSFLEQSPLQAMRMRGVPLDDDIGALLDAAFADTSSRGDPERVPSRRTRMLVFSVSLEPTKVTPRRRVLKR